MSDPATDPASTTNPAPEPTADQVRVTLYEAVGGLPYFETVVDGFFDRVEGDPVVRKLYPDDLAESRRRTALFLAQFWGGPTTYSDERGHPRLRARHLPFVIGQAERDGWVRHMMASIDATELPPSIFEAVRPMLENYIETAATAMINHSDDAPHPHVGA
ncbi:MAG: globin [Acidimicrobiales bacterium]